MYKNTDNEMRIRMRKIHKKSFKIKEIIEEHLRENLKYYMIVSIIMLIGIVLGVIFVNNLDESQKQVAQDYLTKSIRYLKR